MIRPIAACVALLLAASSAEAGILAKLLRCPDGRCARGPVLELRLPPSGDTPVVVVAAIAAIAEDGPMWSTAGYATSQGWQVLPAPEPLFVGPAPMGWAGRVPLPGGLCALVAQAGGPPGRYGLFVGEAPYDDADTRRVRALVAEMKASGSQAQYQAARRAEADLGSLARAAALAVAPTLLVNLQTVTVESCP